MAVVDVFTPALGDLPGVRLVDTPGLGSVLAHNTEATRGWMPNVAVALVTVGAERPLSDEDRSMAAVYYKLRDEDSQEFMRKAPFGAGAPAADAGEEG